MARKWRRSRSPTRGRADHHLWRRVGPWSRGAHVERSFREQSLDPLLEVGSGIARSQPPSLVHDEHSGNAADTPRAGELALEAAALEVDRPRDRFPLDEPPHHLDTASPRRGLVQADSQERNAAIAI